MQKDHRNPVGSLWPFHPVLQELVGFFLIDGLSPCNRASYHAHTQAPTASRSLPLHHYRSLLPCYLFILAAKVRRKTEKKKKIGENLADDLTDTSYRRNVLDSSCLWNASQVPSAMRPASFCRDSLAAFWASLIVQLVSAALCISA